MSNIQSMFFLAASIMTAMTANAEINIIDNEDGNFSVGGNVELNFNFQDRESHVNGDSELNQDGRVLIDFFGEKYTSNDHYVGVKAQPLFTTTGEVVLDDAYFVFGKKESWAIKAGRFEAYDMFPVGLDVFLDYSGDTANDLYTDGYAYLYQSKEARGRGSDGQVMYYQQFGGLYVEIGVMLGDRSNLFNGGTEGQYHGKTIDFSKDSFLIRPVAAYQMGDFRVAASVETNLVSEATVADGVDISDRMGYGLTSNWTRGNCSVNVSVAYLEAIDENNLTVGVNALWNNFGLGYIYGVNEYQNKEFISWAEGDVNVSTWYASYAFRDVLKVQDFSFLLGTYYTMVDNKLDQQSYASAFAEEDDFGARVRLFYEF